LAFVEKKSCMLKVNTNMYHMYIYLIYSIYVYITRFKLHFKVLYASSDKDLKKAETCSLNNNTHLSDGNGPLIY
jgi:hypothetical protein